MVFSMNHPKDFSVHQKSLERNEPKYLWSSPYLISHLEVLVAKGGLRRPIAGAPIAPRPIAGEGRKVTRLNSLSVLCTKSDLSFPTSHVNKKQTKDMYDAEVSGRSGSFQCVPGFSSVPSPGFARNHTSGHS